MPGFSPLNLSNGQNQVQAALILYEIHVIYNEHQKKPKVKIHIANLRNFKTFFNKKNILTASRMTHRVNVEKVVEQAQPQSVGIAGKASSVHL